MKSNNVCGQLKLFIVFGMSLKFKDLKVPHGEFWFVHMKKVHLSWMDSTHNLVLAFLNEIWQMNENDVYFLQFSSLIFITCWKIKEFKLLTNKLTPLSRVPEKLIVA